MDCILNDTTDSYISTEARAAIKAAHDHLQTYVNRHREQIAAAHNPEASSGKSLIIPLFESLVLKKNQEYRYGHFRVDQRVFPRSLSSDG